MQIIIPKNKSLKYIRKYFKFYKLGDVCKSHYDHYKMQVNDVFRSKPYSADLRLLYRLHQLVILNRRTTIVEMGSGWSTLIFISALIKNKTKFSKEVKKLRRNNPFELFVLEDIKKYKNLNQKKSYNFLKKHNTKIRINWLNTKATNNI